jgi:hypothetical protein
MDQGSDLQTSGNEVLPNVSDEPINEKMVPQSAVDKAVKHAKHSAYEQGKREALNSIQTQSLENKLPTASSSSESYSLGGIPSVTSEQVQKMIAEHAQQQAQHYHAHNIASEFLGKLAYGKEQYPDFDEKMDSLELSTIPEVVQLANTVDNTADVMYELANNPHKVASLLTLSRFGNGKLAYLETKKLSDSIKQNKNALKKSVPPEPLSPLKPSNIGIDNGNLSIKELRKQSYLRR